MLVCAVVFNRALGGERSAVNCAKMRLITPHGYCSMFSAAIQIIETKGLGWALPRSLLLFRICLIIKYLTVRVNHHLISHHLGLWMWNIEEEKYGENLKLNIFVWGFFKVNRPLWGIQTSCSKVIRKNMDRCILKIQMVFSRR